MKSIKFDMAFKNIAKNIGLMILVGLIAEITVSLKSQQLYAIVGILLGIASGLSNFCSNWNSEKRIKIILTHSCIGAFSLTLIFFLEI